MTDLSTVKNREGLKPRREPYWQRLAVGQFLGYRPLSTGPGGNWIARSTTGNAGSRNTTPWAISVICRPMSGSEPRPRKLGNGFNT